MDSIYVEILYKTVFLIRSIVWVISLDTDINFCNSSMRSLVSTASILKQGDQSLLLWSNIVDGE